MKSAEYWFVLVNEKNKKELGISIGNEVQVNLCKDYSEYGQSMIEEFQVLLDQDDDFRTYFESLTMDKKRSLLYWASQVKNSDSRLKRVLAIASQLKEAEGQLDFKMINARLKQLNSR